MDIKQHWGKVQFGGRTIAHVDMDAFFAQVEVLDNPDLAGKPLIVGGQRDSARGVVATCSYEARRFGVHSAMPIRRAAALCPHAVFLPVRMERYQSVAAQVRGVLESFSPSVEPLSIDEAFLDMSGCEHFYPNAHTLGMHIKHGIREATGLTASVGIAPNKFVAKIASDWRKPDGLVIIEAARVDTFLSALPVGVLWGVGRTGERRLTQAGLRYLRDVRQQPVERLCDLLGERLGWHVYHLARGRDDRPVEPNAPAKSIGNESTFAKDTPDGPVLRTRLAQLSASVARRLRHAGLYARTVTVKIRYPDFATHTKSRTFEHTIRDDDAVYEVAAALLDELRPTRPLRLLGVYLSQLQSRAQGTLFESGEAGPLSGVIDRVNQRFGGQAIRRGREIDR